MANFIAVKKLQSLHPTDDAGREVLRKIGQGEMVSIEIKRPRNLAFHKKFFAMLKIILDNQEHYKSIDDLLDVCKLAIGHYRTIETKMGQIKIPSSISFAVMDDAAFGEFYDQAVAWVARDVIPGLRRVDLDEEVEAMLIGFGEGP